MLQGATSASTSPANNAQLGTVKLTELKAKLEQIGSSKSLIVSGGARIFSPQKDRNYINLTVPMGGLILFGASIAFLLGVMRHLF